LFVCLFFLVAKLVLIAVNCTSLRKTEIKYYAMLSTTTVHHFAGTNAALGAAAGSCSASGACPSMQLVITISYAKRTTCSGVMAIADPGDSDLLGVAERGPSVCTVSSVRYD
jgi:large subunit ribosomal protein L30e